jgi:hypothetical protein
LFLSSQAGAELIERSKINEKQFQLEALRKYRRLCIHKRTADDETKKKKK